MVYIDKKGGNNFMKGMRKLSAILLAVMLCVGIINSPVFAATTTQDGLKVTLTTDKAEYSQSEEITATLTVENTNDFAVKNVLLEGFVPEGYELSESAEAIMKTDTLEAGKSIEVVVTYVAVATGDSGEDETTKPSIPESEDDNKDTDKKEESSVDTGDKNNIVLYSVMMFGALGIIIVISLNKKRGRNLLSIILCITMVGTSIAWPSIEVEAAETVKTIEVEESIQVEGKEVLLKAVVEYQKSVDVPSYAADDDNDGIVNGIENAFELSDETDDTDGDGIDDYTEIYLIGSDPTKDDSTQDKDADGLTNYDEVFIYKTDASKADTDFDGLVDGEEVSDYKTDPLLTDTDNDGANDGREIELGTDPLKEDDSFQIHKSVQNEDSVEAAVDIILDGEQIDTLEIKSVDNPVLFPENMPGYLGKAYDFSVDGKFNSATISFEFDESILANGADPAIFYFNEETQDLEELETTISGNVASAKVEHFSKYILIDRKVYYDSFKWEDVWDTEGKYNSVEIVMVIDDSGSLGGDYNYDSVNGVFDGGKDPEHKRLEVARSFIDNSNTTSKIGVVKFDGIIDIFTPDLVLCDESGKEELKNILQFKYVSSGDYNMTGVFDSRGYTKMYSGIDAAFDLFSTSEQNDENVLKVMIVFTDGQAEDTSMHSSVVTQANNELVKIYTVGLGNTTTYFDNYLKPLAEKTGGVFYTTSDADQLSKIYEEISKKIDLEADADDDDIPDYYEDNMIAFNGTKIKMDKNNADTDGDGLKDNEEVEIELVYNQDKTKVYIKGKMWSDPTLEDSDYDGVNDIHELEKAKRLDNSFSGKMSGYYDIKNAEYSFDYKEFFNSSSTYSDELCSASLIFANTIYSDCGFTYNAGTEITSIKEMMEHHGFDQVINYKLNTGFTNSDGISVEKYKDDDISEIGIGYNEVTYNGVTKTIVGVVIRGTNGTIEEWSSNFDMGDTDSWDYEHHKGFYTTEERIKKFVNQYVNTYLSGAANLTYWITGHSRGAALSNLLAARLIDEGNTVFAYTFATPATTISSTKYDAKYNSIFNFANTSDFVTYVPLKEWDFGCFGITNFMSIEEAGLESEWCNKTGVSKYNALNKNTIELATSRIAESCCASWDEVHDRAGSQNIDDEQYGYISTRAKRYCDLKGRTNILGEHNGYKLYPSTAFIFQLGAEALAGSEKEKANVMEILPELWNSKYAAVLVLLFGDILSNKSMEGLDLEASLVGDGHAPATYYVLTNN